MFRVVWRRDDGNVGFDDFDSEHEACIVFDFVVKVFDTCYASLTRRNDTNGWLTCSEYGEEF
jgi:hypothetical protein